MKAGRRPPPLVVATYNVHRCIGHDGRQDLDRVATVIRDLEADAVGLQEVESAGAPELDGQLESLGRRTGMTPLAGPVLRRGDAFYGNALLTRLPIESVRRHSLGNRGGEPRGALDVDVRVGEVLLRVIVTHLGPRARERRVQLGRLLEALQRHLRRRQVLVGDFNEWSPLQPVVRRLRRRFGVAPAPATFPARWPILSLDRIWARPSRLLQEVGVVRSPESRMASDHLPVQARLQIDPLPASDDPHGPGR